MQCDFIIIQIKVKILNYVQIFEEQGENIKITIIKYEF